MPITIADLNSLGVDKVECVLIMEALYGEDRYPPGSDHIRNLFAEHVPGHFGWEALRPGANDNEGGAEYLNMGDSYDPTIVYDEDANDYILTSWGDWVEAWETEHTPHRCCACDTLFGDDDEGYVADDWQECLCKHCAEKEGIGQDCEHCCVRIDPGAGVASSRPGRWQCQECASAQES